ncbi:MAG: dihydropteroate synthase [Pseudomonadota bacterium]
MNRVTHILHWEGGSLALDRCRVMGVLNVTPDSFSDGGKSFAADDAVARAWRIAEEGADVLDVGAESTRPGAQAVSEDEERRRLRPVLEALASKKYPLPISLDSRKPSIVKETLENRLVQIINDVEGFRNPAMVGLVKKFRVPAILMHMFGDPRTMQKEYRYGDVVADLAAFFRARLAETGLEDNVVIDPGIGFGKSVDHNLEILRRLEEFHVLGRPIAIGASRKSFIGSILGTELDERLEGSVACAVVAASQGAAIVRVHDVQETVRALRMTHAILEGKPTPP